MQKFTRHGISRLFHIELDKNLKAEDLQSIKEGLKINGKTIEVEEVSWVNNAPKKEVGLKIKHIGNSIIRTIFDHLKRGAKEASVARCVCVCLYFLSFSRYFAKKQ